MNKKMDANAKKSMLIAAGAVGGIFAVFIGIFAFTHSTVKSKNSHEVNSSMPGFNNVRVENGVNTGIDGKYGKMAQEKDQIDASNAEQTGGSFVPSFAPPPKPIDSPKPKSVTGNNTSATTNINYQNQQAQDNAKKLATDEYNKTLEFKRKRVQEMTAEFVQEGYSPVLTGSFIPESKNGEQAGVAQGKTMAVSEAGSGSVFVKAGEKAYISLDTAINTDEPGPVTATVLSGPAMGMTLFGKVTQNADDTVSVQFTSMSLKNGKSVGIDAYAIDPATGRTAVVGSVDHKIFQRFVLPFVAGGAAAYGQIMAQNGTQMVMSPLAGSTATTYNLSGQQIAEAAVGQGVGKLSSTLNQQAQNAKPAVSTEPNLGLEVIFIKEITTKQ